MTTFLLLGENTDHQGPLPALLRDAGYQVTAVHELARCWQELHPALPGTAGQDGAGKGRIVLATALEAAGEGLSPLQTALLALARQATPGWRLNLRQRTLLGPNGKSASLTSLEYAFVKLFSMVEVGQPVSRKQIVHEFGEDYLHYDQNRLDTMVRRLRQKILTRIRLKLPLSTVRVRGFAFDEILVLDI